MAFIHKQMNIYSIVSNMYAHGFYRELFCNLGIIFPSKGIILNSFLQSDCGMEKNRIKYPYQVLPQLFLYDSVQIICTDITINLKAF